MLKKLIVPIVVAGTLLGGVAATGEAYASTPTASVSATTNVKGSAHVLRVWLRTHRRQLRRAGVEISAKTIGVTPQALVAELRSGKSIAEITGEHNVSTQTVVNALVSAADTKISQAVASQKLTPAEGAQLQAAVPGFVTKQVNHTF